MYKPTNPVKLNDHYEVRFLITGDEDDIRRAFALIREARPQFQGASGKVKLVDTKLNSLALEVDSTVMTEFLTDACEIVDELGCEIQREGGF